MTPVIISVFDKKLHNRGTTVIDYGQLEETITKIKEACQKNQWTYTQYVPPTLDLFIKNINEST
jgi:hypothetical protein